MWGCCNGSSGTRATTYRGTAPFSATETQRLRDFVVSRRIGDVQQIRTNLDFHTFGEQFLWPYGFTLDDLAPGLDQDQRDTFAAIGAAMAQPTGGNDVAPYTAEQASDLYYADGAMKDWLWGVQGIFGYTVEMYPGPAGSGGFYPPDEVIAAQTARLRESVLRLLETSDCPYRAIGKQARYCAAVDSPPPGGSPPGAPPPPPPPGPGAPPHVVTAVGVDKRVGVAAAARSGCACAASRSSPPAAAARSR